MFYSKSKNMWFPPEFKKAYEASGTWPEDAKDYPDEVYVAVVRNRGNMIMQPDINGDPVLVDPAPLAPKQLAIGIRAARDWRIAEIAWRYERIARQKRLGLTPTDDIAELDKYVQDLADITLQSTFPQSVIWPEVPA